MSRRITVGQLIAILEQERAEEGKSPAVPLVEIVEAGVGLVADTWEETEEVVADYFRPPTNPAAALAEAAELERLNGGAPP